MAFNFEKAIQAGGTEEGIRTYLNSQGRGYEADQYFSKAAAPAAPAAGPGFLDRTKEALGKRVGEIKSQVQQVFPGQGAIEILDNTLRKVASPEEGDFRKKLASLFVRTTGEIGAGVSDVIGEGMKSGFNALPEEAQWSVKEGAKNLFPTQVEDAAIKALQSGAQGWQEYRAREPEKARDLEGIAKTIMGVADVVGGVQALKGFGKIAQRGARELAEGAVEKGAFEATEQIAPRAPGALQAVGEEVGDMFTRTKQRLERSAQDMVERQKKLSTMNPVEAEAIRSGIDEGTVNVIKTASPENQNMYKKLVQVVKAGVDNPRAAEQAESIIGRSIAEKGLTPAIQKRDVIGRQIGDVVKRLPKEQIDIAPQIQKFEDALKSVGYTVENGELRAGKTAVQGDKAAYQDMYNRIRSGKASPEELHKIRQAIFKEFNLAKARNQTFSADADRVAEEFRRIIAEPITAIDNTYLPLSEQYAKTMDGLSKFLKFMGYTGDIENASLKTLNFGERARGLIGRRANRPQEVLDALFEITDDAGANSTKDIQDLIRFSDYLEGIYGSPKTGTFRSQIGAGVQDVMKEGLTSGPMAGLKSALGKMTGASSVEQQRALENLLESIVPTIDEPVEEVPIRVLKGAANDGPKGSGAPTPKTGVLQMIKSWVSEFYPMKRGELISSPTEKIMIGNTARISRKSVKYIVNSRIEDGYSKERIRSMLERAGEVVDNPDKVVANTNKDHSGSMLSFKKYPGEKEGLIVVHQPDGTIQDVFNAYYRTGAKYEKLFK